MLRSFLTLRMSPNYEVKMSVVNITNTPKRGGTGGGASYIATISGDATTSGGEATLDLNRESQRSEKLKGGWGALARSSVLTVKASRTLKAAGAVLHKKYGRKSLMLTGTLPGSTGGAMKAIAEWSGWIANRVNAWLRRHIPGVDFLYVWEWQERGALHIHYAVGVHNDEKRNYVEKNFRAEWINILRDASRKSGCDLFGKAGGGRHDEASPHIQARAERIRKDIGAYLSKYLSKHVGKIAPEGFYCPGRWWSVSYHLKREIGLNSAFLVTATTTHDNAWEILKVVSLEISDLVKFSKPLINPWLQCQVGRICYFPPEKFAEAWARICGLLEGLTNPVCGIGNKSSGTTGGASRYGPTGTEVLDYEESVYAAHSVFGGRLYIAA
jgi:hypothetical protein